jgi:hypothetical protein
MDQFFKGLLGAAMNTVLEQIPNEVGINISPLKQLVTGERSGLTKKDIPEIIQPRYTPVGPPKKSKLQVVEFVYNGRK